MIKNILWDFDGVILDSMKIKGDGFKELFKKEDQELINKIEQYHYQNGGISRFEKIKYFYENLLNQDISNEKIYELADTFASIIEKNMYDKNNLIMDSVDFIKNNHTKYDFHIVSGAEHKELNDLCEYFELSKYFLSINGSPTKKDILVKNILEKYSYNTNETILIGDAMTDYEASRKNNITFYGFNNEELRKFDYIENFEDFEI